MYRSIIGGAVLTLTFIACGRERTETILDEPMEPADATSAVPATENVDQGATAVLRDTQGAEIGTATLTQEGPAVRIVADLTGLPAGERGFHVHQVGLCEAPDFESAGDHFNPTNASHGLENPQGPHAGDMANLLVETDGSVHADVTNDMLLLTEDQANSLFDADGSALIVHAQPDDHVTQPAGGTGERIACGVVAR